MPLATYNPKLFDAALTAFANAPKNGSAILITKLPGWSKPLTFKLTRDTYYVYMDSACGVRLAICG